MHSRNSLACSSSRFASDSKMNPSQYDRRSRSVIQKPPFRFGQGELDHLHDQLRHFKPVYGRSRCASALHFPARPGASGCFGRGSQAHTGGDSFATHATSLVSVHSVIQLVIPCFVPMEAPVGQLSLPLLCRLDAPSVVPHVLIELCKSYRDAVKLCWDLRRIKNMTRRRLAEEAGLYPPHVSCYLNDGKRQRDLPGGSVRGFEWACGNTAISQWHALQARLTVLEEMQAMRIA